MRYASSILATLLVLTLSAATFAADGDKPSGGGDKAAGKPHLLHGHIKKIDGKTITLAIGKGDNEKDVVVETDENTHFTIDHNPAKLEDLKEGELAAVAPNEGVAKHVDINTTHKDKKAGGDAGKTGDTK